MTRALNALQVAALLISASYGIGFLFGSAEMTLSHGMASSVYGLATATGMLLLATYAPRLWRRGMPVWSLFGQSCGPAAERGVALLSIVWMAGVLAAQIQGGMAILRLLGLGEWAALGLVPGGVLVASRLKLGIASSVFSLFLVGSGLVLLYVLWSGAGGSIYARAPVLFARDLALFDARQLASIVLAVVALVCTGADYHQFLLAARRPADAALGCLLAFAGLMALSFVPALVVLGLIQDGALTGRENGKQLVPIALTQAATRLGAAGLAQLFLLGLLGAALGCGAAIVRAIASALDAATTGRAPASAIWPSVLVIGLGAALAVRGQGIVATMVSLNIIYIASIALPFGALLAGRPLSARTAVRAMVCGFSVAAGLQALHWTHVIDDDADLLALLAGLGAAVVVVLRR